MVIADPPDRESLVGPVRIMQLIVAALVFALGMFFVVVLVLATENPAEEPLISLVGVAVGLVALVMSVVVPGALGATKGASGVEAYQLRLILSCAILDGGAFFNLVAYMIETQSWSLAVAALLLVAMVLKFPTVDRVVDWMQQNRRRVDEDRAFEN